MNFETAFPLKFWINLGRRQDRRVETEARLEELGIEAERFPAVDARFVRKKPEARIKGQEELKLGAGRAGGGLDQGAPATLAAVAA